VPVKIEPISANEGCTRLWKSEIHFDGIFRGFGRTTPEWRKTAKPKLPFTFAGLWENWKDPESGERLRTCTIITGEPNELVAQIHLRMPVILPQATSRGLARGNRRWKLKSVIGPLS
jgi:hypothetical protein